MIKYLTKEQKESLNLYGEHIKSSCSDENPSNNGTNGCHRCNGIRYMAIGMQFLEQQLIGFEAAVKEFTLKELLEGADVKDEELEVLLKLDIGEKLVRMHHLTDI